MIPAMHAGRQADSDRRRQRVVAAIKNAAKNGTPISVSGIARQAGVDRTFLYRHRDLLVLVHAAELEPTGHDPAAGPPVSRASLQADLAHAQTGLEQKNVELTASLEDIRAELAAAREANRDLTRALNQRS
ncbi:DUF6262 family protein [Kitasatospora griseola]|uniref:DUF6262 family protein n=1 Tax=Kitasatospora griseola TaxID=2064 RepID=UPI0036DF81E6